MAVVVVDGNGVGGQQTRFLVASEKLTLEVGLCPDAFVCLQLILKPFSIEVAVVGAVDPRHDDTVCRVLSGTRHEYPAFAGIIVLFEQQGAADDGAVLTDDTLHVIEHHVGIVNVALNVVDIVLCGHMHIRQLAAYLLMILEQKAQITFLGLVEHILPDGEIHHAGNDNHHHQNHRHDAIGEPCRQGAPHTTSVFSWQR